ncbi:MAG: hypothetical protein PWQ67_868 [Clostridia bacterium]|jgi:hypothetical protein|nr:hypothetical protein [Clostridia bacterium]MDN5322414.1 hypothetical protein [Clostridia bacterium]
MKILLIIAFIGIALFEVPGLIQRKYWRELIFFLILLLLAFILSFLQVIGIKIPSPIKGIEFLVKYLKFWRNM